MKVASVISAILVLISTYLKGVGYFGFHLSFSMLFGILAAIFILIAAFKQKKGLATCATLLILILLTYSRGFAIVLSLVAAIISFFIMLGMNKEGAEEIKNEKETPTEQE